MPYILERFGQAALPSYNAEDDAGTGGSRVLLADLPGGGVVDLLGEERAPRGRASIAKRAVLFGESDADLLAQFRALRALRGRRDRLVRKAGDGSYEWAWSRLVEVAARRTFRHRRHLEIELRFEVLDSAWRGRHYGAWQLDTGLTLNGGLTLDSGLTFELATPPATVEVANGGNADVTDVRLTLTAHGAVTDLSIFKSGETDLRYTAQLADGQSLVLDAGASAVTLDGVDAYANLASGTGHRLDGWLRLQPGNNQIRLNWTGGTLTLTVEYDEAWE